MQHLNEASRKSFFQWYIMCVCALALPHLHTINKICWEILRGKSKENHQRKKMSIKQQQLQLQQQQQNKTDLKLEKFPASTKSGSERNVLKQQYLLSFQLFTIFIRKCMRSRCVWCVCFFFFSLLFFFLSSMWSSLLPFRPFYERNSFLFCVDSNDVASAQIMEIFRFVSYGKNKKNGQNKLPSRFFDLKMHGNGVVSYTSLYGVFDLGFD